MGRIERIGARRPAAIAHQDNGARGVGTGSNWRELLLFRLARRIQATTARGIARQPTRKNQRLQIDASIGEERCEGNIEGATRGRAGLQLEPADSREEILPILGRRLHERCGPAERNDANAGIWRALFDEGIPRAAIAASAEPFRRLRSALLADEHRGRALRHYRVPHTKLAASFVLPAPL